MVNVKCLPTSHSAIKSLVIGKHNGSLSTLSPISASLLQPFKNSMERPILLSPSFSSEELFYENNSGKGESNSEWYTRDFSKISPFALPSTQNAESMFVPATQSTTQNHSLSPHLPFPHSPLPSQLLVNGKVEANFHWITHHCSSQCPSTLWLLLPPSSPLPLPVVWTTYPHPSQCPMNSATPIYHMPWPQAHSHLAELLLQTASYNWMTILFALMRRMPTPSTSV